jgi:outer membrane lipoprotein-sorting protein
MSDWHSNRDEQLFDRVLQSIRDEAIPVFPDTLPHVPEVDPSNTRTRRWKMLSRLSIPVAAAVMIVMVAACWLLTGGSSQQALADMKDALNDIKSLQYEMTGFRDDEIQKVHVTLLGKHLMRAELSTGEISVTNLEQGISMQLKPKEKHAIHIKGLDRDPGRPNLFEYLSAPTAKATEKLPGRVINGVETIGFRVDIKPKVGFDVYVDPKTKLPLRVEIEAQKGKPPVVFSKFVFNPRVDESAFSTTPPDGYTVEVKDMAEQRKALIRSKHKEEIMALEKVRKATQNRAESDRKD